MMAIASIRQGIKVSGRRADRGARLADVRFWLRIDMALELCMEQRHVFSGTGVHYSSSRTN
jgi:hypothetical protein